MKPKSDASKYYKTLSTVEKKQEDIQKAQEAQKAIRATLGMSDTITNKSGQSSRG